ncbi:MAG: ketopantoate reductase family protein [Rhodovarius sp.]|nr:ketopantoate reductase family protein [Rhodovarius sp.]MCX7932166.1 ketopantoate reductase family protein [Rhodovarius sp.]MDW8314676.1 ketopantoate reductase family protein [Rhodovarius sp.]
MQPRIAIIGAGAVGGYLGAHLAAAGQDVTLIDPWPAHVEAMRAQGLTVTHLRDVPPLNTPVRALHICDVQALSRERPIDIAFICVKSYDTAWAAALIRPYLAPAGFAVSLQNGINEDRLAEILGWGRVVGAIASSITVELTGPGRVHRNAGKASADHVVFRVGEVHGRVTERVRQVAALCALADRSTTTTNLWGERWTKLVVNAMGNGLSACTGLRTGEIQQDPELRAFAARVGAEAIRVGQALGFALEEVLHMDPELIARAGEGDPEARAEYDRRRLAEAKARGGAHRPSMGQDIIKGRRTEIADLNGVVVERAAALGIPTPANAALIRIVQAVERGEIAPDPAHIKALRLN